MSRNQSDILSKYESSLNSYQEDNESIDRHSRNKNVEELLKIHAKTALSIIEIIENSEAKQIEKS